VIFDRSWYNRAGVERVMGFARRTRPRGFLSAVPDVERPWSTSDLSPSCLIEQQELLDRFDDRDDREAVSFAPY
jgi:polyphosphate kinase 2 (PPK2 family)